MKIYTKTGDKGLTGLGDGSRVGKDDARIQTYGTIDELNSFLGLCITEINRPALAQALQQIQVKLFALGSVVANPKLSAAQVGDKTDAIKEKSRLGDDDVTFLERLIDEHDAALIPLRSFILPGGSRAAALLHCARTVCRRGERELISLKRNSPVPDIFVIYLNRLSDLLFVLARSENAHRKVDDVLW